MLYSLVKFFVRLALQLFCRKITINDRSVLQSKGPLLLACNHPNSFFDAILVATLFTQPVHFLARGDAFRKPLAKKLLTKLNLIPIYRLSEGREYLALNDTTFERCHQILLQGGIVLIFSEGLCVHQWALRPLKKGTARIALNAWAEPAIAKKFRVLPVSLNYNSFSDFGKRIIIHVGIPMTGEVFLKETSEGEKINHFNQMLSALLNQGILQCENNADIVQMFISNHSAIRGSAREEIGLLKNKQEEALQKKLLAVPHPLRSPYLIAITSFQLFTSSLGVLIILIPAVAGWILHIPLYLPIKKLIRKNTTGTVFYDSVLFVILLILYPIYYLLLNFISLFLIQNEFVNLIILLLPILAGVFLLWKDCFQRTINYVRLRPAQRRDIKILFR